MKSLLTIFTFLFTVMFSSISFSEWTRVGENINGTIYYVDFERMRKHDGYVYYWWLSDLLKPDKDGDLSYKSYQQGDCKLFRRKSLNMSYHKEPMGGGIGADFPAPDKWIYPQPDSSDEHVLETVCSR